MSKASENRLPGRRSGWLIGLGVLAVIAGAAVVHVARPRLGISTAFHWAMHAPVFATLTLVLLVALRSRFPARDASVWAGGLALAAGLAGEALQLVGPGTTSGADLGLDLVGILGVLTAFAAWDPPVPAIQTGWRRRAAGVVAAILLTATLAPLAWLGVVLTNRAAALPGLLSFDHPWEGALYAEAATTSVPDGWPLADGKAAVVWLDRPYRPGLNFHDPYPDWSGHQALTFLAASLTGEPVRVRLRIHDRSHNHRSHDRFTRTLVIGPEPTRYAIALSDVARAPRDRQLDLSEIDGLILFGLTAHDGDRIMVDDLRLQ